MRRIKKRSLHTVRAQGVDLILHQGDQRRNNDSQTIEHERHHIFIYQSYHQAIAGNAALDADGDEITAQGEGTLDGIKSDPANGDTFNMGGGYSSYGDNEVRCREVERKLTVKYFPEKDWANPGCQTLPIPYGP